MIPHPGFGIDRFPDRAQQAQRVQFAFLHRAFAFPHQGADRRRCGVESIDLVLVTDLPEARGIGIIWHAFKHQRDRPIGQRAIDDIAVTGDPADIRCAPIDIAFMIVEDIFMGHGGIDHIAAGRVQHAFGLAGGAGCIEDKQRVFCGHFCGFTLVRHILDHVVVPDIAPVDPIDLATRALHNDAGFHRFAFFQRLVGIGLQRDFLCPAQAFIRRDHHDAFAVIDAPRQRIGGESAKDDGMHRTDAGTGQHGIGGFGDHGHIDTDAVAFLDALVLHGIGQTADMAVQLAIGDCRIILRVVAFPEYCGLITTAFQMPVNAIVGRIQRPVLVPFDGDIRHHEVHILHRAIGLDPIDALAMFTPESLRVIN